MGTGRSVPHVPCHAASLPPGTAPKVSRRGQSRPGGKSFHSGRSTIRVADVRATWNRLAAVTQHLRWLTKRRQLNSATASEVVTL